MSIPETTPSEVHARRSRGEPFVLLDVREPWELELCAVDWAKAIPMNDVPDRLAELDPGTPLVVMCHHGGRSLRVAQFLAQRGYRQVANLTGGIDAWREQIDPSMRPY
ncbi:MAG: rhodanese-like domain-containing protein [Steroidobacteraceae bacterium]